MDEASSPGKAAQLSLTRAWNLPERPTRSGSPRVTCSSVARIVRLVGTYLKGALYGILLTKDPQLALTAGLPTLIEVVGDATGCRETLEHFYGQAAEWRQVRTQPDALRGMFTVGMMTLDAIMRWNLDGLERA